MTPDDRACIAIDHGGATTTVGLLGRAGECWRYLGGLSAPATIPVEALIDRVVAQLLAADPSLAAALDAASAAVRWPRLVARTGPPPRMVVLAATERTLGRLSLAARRAGWSVRAASAEVADPLEMSRLVLGHDVRAVLVGASDPPTHDERPVIGDLAALVAAAAQRRPELTVVLAGGLADHAGHFESPVGTGGEQRVATEQGAAAEQATGPVVGGAPELGPVGRSEDEVARAQPGTEAPAVAPGGPSASAQGEPTDAAAVTIATTLMGLAASLIIAPAPNAGDPPGDALRTLLDQLRAGADDGRHATVRTTGSLAAHLGRRVETLEIGYDGGMRAVAWPAGAGDRVHVRWATAAEAALVPDPVDDETVDGVLEWSTLGLDRYRLRDRLAELRLAPWSEAHGDGAPLRTAAARAALARLIALTPELERPVPDLIVVTGGAWAVAPGPAVALAIADVVRRPGACQLMLDHARLLGPLGTIEDDAARLALVADLADDLLAPLGTVVISAGLRTGRSAGRCLVHAASGTTELDLVPGGLELVDLPPGESATAEFRFRDTVDLGVRGKRFAIDVAGGLGGLLVDMRDVPLHLPDRADRRRELLGAWQRSLWPELGS